MDIMTALKTFGPTLLRFLGIRPGRRQTTLDLLARAYADVHDAILIYSHGGAFLYANPRALAELRLESTEHMALFRAGLIVYDLDGARIEQAQWPLFRAMRGEVVRDMEQIVHMPHFPPGEQRRHARISARQTDFGGLVDEPLILVSVSDITRFKTVEQRLRASEDAARREQTMLTAVLDALPTGVVVADRSGRFLRANAANAAFIGSVPDAGSIEDYAAFEGYWPHNGARLAPSEWPLARACLHGETTIARRIDIRGSDGRLHNLSCSAAPFRTADGEIAGGVVACEDLSDVAQAERAVAYSNTQLRLLIDGARDHAFFMLDAEGRVATWSAGAERLKTYDEAEIIGQPWSIFFTATDAAAGKPAALLAEARQTGLAYFQGWRLRKDGTPFWADAVLSAIHDGDTLIGFAEVARDRTEQRASQAELRLRDQALRAVSQGILIVDARHPDQPIVQVSGGFERLTGYSADEALGRNCRFLQGPRSDRETIARIRSDLNAGRDCSVEIVNYRKDGSTFWNALYISPLRGEDGAIDTFIGLMADVTQRRDLEERLQQTHRMDALGRLAGGVAHDFNNILTIINGNVEELQDAWTPGSTVRHRLDLIAKAGKRAELMTNQLLTFSKRSVVTMRSLDLGAVVEQMRPLLASLVDDTMAFVVRVEPGLPAIVADPSQMEQVLLNLVINARDALSAGGSIVLDVRRAPGGDTADPPTRDAILLSVTDTGAGMTEATRARAFEPYFTTKGDNGTGLGLSTVFGIVSQTGGGIQLDSAPGRGTRVAITLPGCAEAPLPDPTPAPPRALRNRLSVVVAEDDEDVRQLVVNALERAGHVAHDFANGADALAFIRRGGPVDLLVTDVIMPGIGGVPLHKAAAASVPDLRTLFMTGYHRSRIDADSGVTQILPKPFTGTSLLHAIGSLMLRTPA